MHGRLGEIVVAWLERSGERHLRNAAPHLYSYYLLQIGGADTLRRYDGTEEYWHQVQAVLDCFFTSAERVSIMEKLIEWPVFKKRPEFGVFLAQAKAERQVRDLVARLPRLSVEDAHLPSVS